MSSNFYPQLKIAARASLSAALILGFIFPGVFSVFIPSEARAAATISKTLTRPVNEIGLVGWWTMDGPDTLTNIADKSGSGNNGSFSHGGSGTTTAPGRVGQAMSFDGTNDWVNTATDVGGLDAKTFAGWFRWNSLGSGWQMMVMDSDPVFDNANYVGLSTNGSSEKYIYLFQSYNSGLSYFDTGTDFAPSLNTWYHVAGVIDKADNSLRLYINGALYSTYQNAAVGASTFYNPSGGAGIGGKKFAGYYFNGNIDDVRVYTRALSAAEVTRLYQIGATSKIAKTLPGRDSLTSGLVGWWTFDGPDMLTNIADKSGQGDNGSLIHSSSGTTTVPGKVGQALSFDGINDYVTLGASYNGVQSVSFWIKVATSTTLQKILDLNGTATVTIDSGTLNGNNFTSPTRYVDGTAASTINDTNWHHVAITTGTGINASAMNIGRISAAYLGGSLDDVRIYSRALSAAEVLQLYNLGR